jgi:hypothetical protein
MIRRFALVAAVALIVNCTNPPAQGAETFGIWSAADPARA